MLLKRFLSTNRNLWMEFVMDIKTPHLWFPNARFPRNIVCHVGPTNSGKTFAALSELKKSKNGIYCGPLRLLAWEISETLNANGVPCNLLTGQEKNIVENSYHTSCTIEMVNLQEKYECAVIDEVQLIGDKDRGWAWTQAFLGLQAKTIHICGSSIFVPIIKQICDSIGDQYKVIEYNRLSPLVVDDTSLHSSFRNIQSNDCLIGFSRQTLHKIKSNVDYELSFRQKHNLSLNNQVNDNKPKCCVI